MLQLKTWRALGLCAFCLTLSFNVAAQTNAMRQAPANNVAAANTAASDSGHGTPSDLDEVRRQLREQQLEIERMRALVTQQSGVIEELRQRVDQTTTASATTSSPAIIKTDGIASSDTINSAPQTSGGKVQANDSDARLTRVEEQVKKTGETVNRQLGSITFSGDLRVQYDSFFNQINALPNGGNAGINGNDLSSRNRFRLRARLALRGLIGKEFDWGLRFSTGSLPDVVSANQVLTDFYTRKQFALDQAYIAYSPQSVKGLRLQAGKFETPWLHTEMTIDNDINPEGFSETYSHNYKNSKLSNLTFVAWQLPFLERSSAFVRNANGTVNLDQSRRGGRDLALFGAQLRTRLEPSQTLALTLSAADLFFAGTQFISPAQFFGGQIQLPVTFTIPATATTPAQIITTQVSIPRDLLVTGNGNLGLSTASNNAINRDGRLASGYNLVDLIGRLDYTASKRFPVAVLFNFVHNTQVHDVSYAGAGGATLFQRNRENNGYWAEMQVGKIRERGDVLFGYTFARIEKDAVLTPFNFSDVAQQSDVRAQRLTFSYAADARVTLSAIGIFTERPNGLLGVFGATPTGSLNRPTSRIQLESVFRF